MMLLLLCSEHLLVVCTDVTPTCSTREPTHTHLQLQVMAIVSTSSVYESDNIQQLLGIPVVHYLIGKKVKRFFQEAIDI